MCGRLATIALGRPGTSRGIPPRREALSRRFPSGQAQIVPSPRHGPTIALTPVMSALRRIAPLLSAVTLLFSVSSAAAPAQRSPVTLDSTFATPRADPAIQRVLRETLEHELSKVDFGNMPYRGHYVVSVALLQLRRTETNGKKTTCEMGLALRDGHDVLVASIHGRATAESESGDTSSLDAMEAAAHSAVSRLPDAVRASEKK
jgi:hypothetical protein